MRGQPEGVAARLTSELDGRLAVADAALTARWPGEPGTRQPVHTVYVPAHRVGLDGISLVERHRRDALALLDEHGPDPSSMAAAVGWTDVGPDLWSRVRRKLEREPVEDLRIDLEDGYGRRSDDEEDNHAIGAAHALAQIGRLGGRESPEGLLLPFSYGVRIKSLEAITRARGLRTLDLVVSTLSSEGALPEGFVVTLPKVTSADQVRAFVHACEQLEAVYGLPGRTLRFEIQIETPQAIVGAEGTATVASMVHAAEGRCSGLHYGTYDYTAALGVAAAYQSMEHPAADYAKSVMQVAAAGTGARVCDGSTNVLPVGDRAAVHAAWALHARLVRRSLERGFYQGWDLHPGQLPTRYLATFAFYRHGMASAASRLRAYSSGEASGVLDEPATALALASFLLRGVDCGALALDEVTEATDLYQDALARHARRQVAAHWPGETLGLVPFNAMPELDVRRALLTVCASPRWAAAVAGARPYDTVADLHAIARAAVADLDDSDLDGALAGHRRIGEADEDAPDSTSRREQAGVQGADPRVLAALAEGNQEYEARFGHLYLVCASGRIAEELLGVLRSRLANEPEAERRVVRDELAKINLLRLDRLLRELGDAR